MNAELIPHELQQHKQWVLWKREMRGGKLPTKVPYLATSPSQRASSTDPKTWSSFESACEAYRQREDVDGIGFVLTPDDPFVGIDIDVCIDSNGTISPEALELIRSLDSYTEISPSGTGLRVFINAEFAHPLTGTHGGNATFPGCKKIEVYFASRYLTVTGNQVPGTPNSIGERQGALDDLVSVLWPATPPAVSAAEDRLAGTHDSASVSDDELLDRARKAKNGDKFVGLFDHGNTAEHGDDDSRADLALCSLLAFWTDNDPGRIDRLFRRSRLYREKWERRDYRDATISKAIESCSSTSQGPGRQSPRDRRPRIKFRPSNLGDATRRAEEVLNARPEAILFERASCLSQIVPQRFITEPLKNGGAQSRELHPDDTVTSDVNVERRHVIRPIRLAPFLSAMSDAMVFQRMNPDGSWRACGIPIGLARALFEQESWSLPVLAGVSEIPLLRDDGSVHSAHGYDPRTGFYLAGDKVFEIPLRPAKGDAERALKYLNDELFVNFPFVEQCHRSAAVALLLSLAARPNFRPGTRDECIPSFMCTAPIRGSGKTLLFKAIHAGLFSQLPFINIVPHNKEEWGKTLLTLALEGHGAVLWDNVESGTAFGSPHLDAMLTSGCVTGRILGVSRSGSAMTNAIHMISGNNLRLKGDLPRRTIPIRQDAKSARPELRSGFRHADLVAWAMEHQSEIVVAAFTILRAHALAGFPMHDLSILGGFSKWDRVIRSPLLWLGFGDPCGGIQDVHDHADDDTSDRRELLESLSASLGDRWFESNEAYAMGIAGKDQFPRGIGGPRPELTPANRLYNALLPDTGRRLSPVGVGKRLSAIVDSPAGALVLRRTQDASNKALWRVEDWSAVEEWSAGE